MSNHNMNCEIGKPTPERTDQPFQTSQQAAILPPIHSKSTLDREHGEKPGSLSEDPTGGPDRPQENPRLSLSAIAPAQSSAE
ncbi:hypothetical protein PoB_002446000 [Plakobranchus ocellatus]|uniref:Uncharacterized protein n=1 Tax=Plakobranchus ocellatus TaxID=259542 RepID=A0AAV3ZQF5_9GAST|nr:hypothetical protein PoB_002446000 [Plakobranchus ocellatus]